MPERDWRLRLHDLVEALATVESYVAGQDFTTFETDRKTVDAVVRNLEIVGEAVNALPQAFRDQHNEIPWDDVRAMRNILAHAYFRVDLDIVWKTATVFGPRLLAYLRHQIDEAPSCDGSGM